MARSLREPFGLVLSVMIELNPQAGLLIRIHSILPTIPASLGDNTLPLAYRGVILKKHTS